MTKRILGIIITLAMIIGMISGLTLTASAAEDILTIKMYDTTNDTWDGSEIQVYEDGELIATVTKTSYTAEQTWTHTYNPLADYTFYWVKGIWLWETSFDILVNDEIKFSAATSNCQSYTDGQLLFELKNECTHSFAGGSIVCGMCGKSCGIDFDHVINSEKICELCKNACGSDIVPHDCSNDDGICAGCGESCEHEYNDNGICMVCDGYMAAEKVSSSHHPELNGTHNGYYAIENAGQLYWFADYVNCKENGTSYGYNNNYYQTVVNAVLTDDISVNTDVIDSEGNLKSGTFKDWTPIGNGSAYFAGEFDGNNHTISGLYLDVYVSTSSDATATNKYVGLFGYCSDATVKNVTVTDSFFGGYEWVGAIAGCFWGNSGYMENCVSYATVKGLQNVGGISGGLQYASATNCHNHGLVMGSNMTGGFTGRTGYSSVFTNCSNTGTVKWISGSNGYLGGFVADASQGSGTNRAKFVNCFNSGDIIYDSNSSFSKQIGGFASMINGTYENCYSSGSITINENATGYKIGGFGGSAYSNLTITNCYYDNTKVTYGAVDDADRDGVTGKSTEQFTSGEVCYLLNDSSSENTVVWKQELSGNTRPCFEGPIVYMDGEKYYNPSTELTVTSSNVTIENLSEAAILVVASYKNKKMVDVKTIPVSSSSTKTISSTGLDVSDYHEIRAFLWKDLSDMTPLCEGDVYDKTDAFEGEWVGL